MDLTEKGISSKEVFKGVLLHAFVDEVLLPNGKTATREYLKHNGAVCLVPVTEQNEVIMVRQFRYPFHTVMLEAPAGKIDPGETPLEAAERELREETGIEAAELIEMGKYYPSVAYTDEVIWMYLVKGLKFGGQNLDEDEFLNTERIPLQKLVSMVLAGEIPDGKTQTAILKAKYMLENS